MNLQSTFQMNNGNRIPVIAMGSWDSRGDEGYQACLDALEAGYRHLDTASYYENEAQVGAAVRDSGIPREEIFVTSKIWYTDMVEGKQEAAFEKTLKELGLEYLDLYLLHWPINDVAGSWKILEKYYDQGLIKNIGVSNFNENHLKRLEKTANVAPAVDQIEICPFLVQKDTVDYCKGQGIIVEAWGPLAEGQKNIFQNEMLSAIGTKHGKSVAQVILRWHIQRGVVVIPKSTHKERMEQNLDVFDFSLEEEDMEAIRALDEGESLFFNHYDPATVEMLTNMGKTRKV